MSTPPDLTGATRIAFEDSRKGDDRPRWTELAVYYLPEPAEGGKRWVATSTGCSSKPGETSRVDSVTTFSLERALDFFGEVTPLVNAVRIQALDWRDAHPEIDVQQHGEGPPYPIARTAGGPCEATTDEQALEWLFPGESTRRVADRLGMGESTLRMALKAGTAVKVPLLAIVPFLDREQLRAQTEPV